MKSLQLKEGDDIEITANTSRKLRVTKDRTPEEVLESIRRRARPLPAGFKFDHEEANRR